MTLTLPHPGQLLCFPSPTSRVLLSIIPFCYAHVDSLASMVSRIAGPQRHIVRPRIPADATATAWMLEKSMPVQEHCDHLRKALVHQQDLQSVITALSTKADGEGAGLARSEVEDLVRDAQRQLDGLHQYFSAFLNPIFYNERIPSVIDGIPAAHRTFAVPELLEMILNYVDTPDILSFQHVNHALYDTINESSNLQRLLSLRADDRGSPIRMPFREYTHRTRGGFFCYAALRKHPLPLDTERQNIITISAAFADRRRRGADCHHRLPRIGARWRRMFICQPPVHKMEAKTTCCAAISSVESPPHSAGLTIGDLHDASDRLAAEHCMCVQASRARDHDVEGFVMVAVSFATTVVLSESDPMLLRQRSLLLGTKAVAAAVPGVLEGDDANRHVRRMQAYIKYKKTGGYWEPPKPFCKAEDLKVWFADVIVQQHMRETSRC